MKLLNGRMDSVAPDLGRTFPIPALGVGPIDLPKRPSAELHKTAVSALIHPPGKSRGVYYTKRSPIRPRQFADDMVTTAAVPGTSQRLFHLIWSFGPLDRRFGRVAPRLFPLASALGRERLTPLGERRSDLSAKDGRASSSAAAPEGSLG